ncbi:hypothetical protein VTJ49DRAFT_1693 [Mycothermus thermophilus]|uniref:Uncharacterized protein n=1 Tax=Humicola insolens TaxID=85995 RepID=A0ABR3VBZ5_HUMIN
MTSNTMDPITPTIDLTGLRCKSILITGGASGMGLATARAWSAAGAFVTIADIQPLSVGEPLARSFGANYVWCDVTSWDSQVTAFKAAITSSPSRTLDVVVTFAGIAVAPGNQVDLVVAGGQPSLDANPPRPDTRNIDINLVGTYYSSWLALYYFRLPPTQPHPTTASPSAPATSGSSTDKSLVLVSSIAAYMDAPLASTYTASKAGVRGLFRSMRSRTAEIGVRCNLLAPWFVDTPLLNPTREALAAAVGESGDLGKAVAGFADVEVVVAAAGYCAVEKGVHGKAFVVQPEGIFDLMDDYEHGWAGDQMRPIMAMRKQAGYEF